MYGHQKKLWLKILQMYKEMTYLWDPKHKDYANQPRRTQAYDKLFEEYKKIDGQGTVDQMKKKIINFRTTYIKEMKKKQKAMENGEDYTPTLWYYNHFKFLTEKPLKNIVTDGDVFRFNRMNNKIYLDKEPPGTSLKRKRSNLNSSKNSLANDSNQSEKLQDKTRQESSDEEDRTVTQRDPQPNQLKSLLERQMKLIESISQIMSKKEDSWEVIGRAIGIQLFNLEEKQRVIAQKLISDVIFYAGINRLTMESFVNVDNYRQESEDHMIHEQIEYLDPESPEYIDNE